LLRWEEEINNSTIVGFITKPFEYSLFDFVKSKKIQEKEAMKIFDQIIKAIYSLYQEEFLTRQVRSEHIVFSEGKWKLATLIFSH
jgi:predicted membrane-bound spermidine synthase